MQTMSSWMTVGGLAILVGTFLSGPSQAETLNALFMSQTAYSDDDVRAMTHDFQVVNPSANVNLEFVPY